MTANSSRLGDILTRTRVWKLTGGAFPWGYPQIEFHKTLTIILAQIKVALLWTALAWQVSQPEQKFGSYRAEHFRQLTPILSYTEPHKLFAFSNLNISNLTGDTFCEQLLRGRYLNQNESLEADGRSISVRLHQNWIPQDIAIFAQVQRLEPDFFALNFRW